MKFGAQFRKGICDRRIGVFRQKYPLHASGPEGFPQLFGTHHDLWFSASLFSPALGYSTFFFLIHTKTYYTQFFKKVNKNIENNFDILLLSWYQNRLFFTAKQLSFPHLHRSSIAFRMHRALVRTVS